MSRHRLDEDGVCTKCGYDGAELSDQRMRERAEWARFHNEACPESELTPIPDCIKEVPNERAHG